MSVNNAVFQKLDPKKAAMVAVGIQSSEAEVKRFAERFGAKYPLAADPKGLLGRPYNVQVVPTYFILDPHRVVKFEGNDATAESFITNVNSLVH